MLGLAGFVLLFTGLAFKQKAGSAQKQIANNYARIVLASGKTTLGSDSPEGLAAIHYTGWYYYVGPVGGRAMSREHSFRTFAFITTSLKLCFLLAYSK